MKRLRKSAASPGNAYPRNGLVLSAWLTLSSWCKEVLPRNEVVILSVAPVPLFTSSLPPSLLVNPFGCIKSPPLSSERRSFVLFAFSPSSKAGTCFVFRLIRHHVGLDAL